MYRQIFLILAISIMATGLALADPVKPPKHMPEWTDHNENDPGVTQVKKANLSIAQPVEPVDSAIPELAGIVVLCAREEKEKFEKEWGKYVKHHKLEGRELQKTIQEVSDKAAKQRKSEWAEGKGGSDEAKWKAERRKIMSEVAKQMFGPSAR